MQVVGFVWVLCALAVFLSACDAPHSAVAALEERLREQSSTEPKTGVLRALQIVSTTHAITQNMAAPTESSCELALPDDRAYTYRFRLEFERKSAAGVESRWTEVRILRRDDDGDLAMTMEADFRTELAGEGRRTPQWRLVEQDSYISDDGGAFYRRDASAHERRRLVQAASTTLQTLLDAVSTGWSRVSRDDRAEPTFKNGGERLICGPPSTLEGRLSFDGGWLRRFETRATPLSGELAVVDQGSRRFDARWQLEDGTTLQAHFEDRLTDGSEPVEAPDAPSIVDVERDQSLRRVEHLIEEMTRRGLIVDEKRSATQTKPDHETK